MRRRIDGVTNASVQIAWFIAVCHLGMAAFLAGVYVFVGPPRSPRETWEVAVFLVVMGSITLSQIRYQKMIVALKKEDWPPDRTDTTGPAAPAMGRPMGGLDVSGPPGRSHAQASNPASVRAFPRPTPARAPLVLLLRFLVPVLLTIFAIVLAFDPVRSLLERAPSTFLWVASAFPLGAIGASLWAWFVPAAAEPISLDATHVRLSSRTGGRRDVELAYDQLAWIQRRSSVLEGETVVLAVRGGRDHVLRSDDFADPTDLDRFDVSLRERIALRPEGAAVLARSDRFRSESSARS